MPEFKVEEFHTSYMPQTMPTPMGDRNTSDNPTQPNKTIPNKHYVDRS